MSGKSIMFGTVGSATAVSKPSSKPRRRKMPRQATKFSRREWSGRMFRGAAQVTPQYLRRKTHESPSGWRDIRRQRLCSTRSKRERHFARWVFNRPSKIVEVGWAARLAGTVYRAMRWTDANAHG